MVFAPVFQAAARIESVRLVTAAGVFLQELEGSAINGFLEEGEEGPADRLGFWRYTASMAPCVEIFFHLPEVHGVIHIRVVMPGHEDGDEIDNLLERLGHLGGRRAVDIEPFEAFGNKAFDGVWHNDGRLRI